LLLFKQQTLQQLVFQLETFLQQLRLQILHN
jgi:hypothetical protein